MAADQLDQEQHRHERQVLEQQHREGGPPDRAVDAGDREHQRGRGEGEREAERDCAAETGDPADEQARRRSGSRSR